MGKIKEPVPVKLITGMISNNKKLLQQVMRSLSEIYGPIDFSSQDIPFTFTSYYEKELGFGLLRKFCSFERLVDPSLLCDVKILTNRIEREFSRDVDGIWKRQINIDPGYIALSKLVLASAKDRSHRIYIGKGVYAEVTLQYEKKTFNPWFWTYPDYRTEEYIKLFNIIRDNYAFQLKNAEHSSLRSQLK